MSCGCSTGQVSWGCWMLPLPRCHPGANSVRKDTLLTGRTRGSLARRLGRAEKGEGWASGRGGKGLASQGKDYFHPTHHLFSHFPLRPFCACWVGPSCPNSWAAPCQALPLGRTPQNAQDITTQIWLWLGRNAMESDEREQRGGGGGLTQF